MSNHLDKRSGETLRAIFAIARLKGLRPKRARQLYEAIVLPMLDHGAPVWFAPGRRGLKAALTKRARLEAVAARMIIQAFRSVSWTVARDEASLEPQARRLTRK
ncbi:Hypothetical protein D9617_74g064570 [Elsinoe fawcettii]|nr:Hypothetical protein D9617_74g064570 [Elsinoe fawcettii]